MIGLGGAMALLCAVCFAVVRLGKLEKYPLLLRVMVFAIPIPYLAAESGWVVAEVGRQPWIVYNVLKTSDAVSKSVGATQVFVSLAGFVLLYGLLALADLYLLTRAASKGPEKPENTGPQLSGKGA
jgi:cytochrome d ubiquinol oxidase subunit I